MKGFWRANLKNSRHEDVAGYRGGDGRGGEKNNNEAKKQGDRYVRVKFNPMKTVRVVNNI